MAFRIKDVRLSKGYSQARLAEILQVSVASLSAWEVGTRYPPLETAVKIADRLDVSIDYLLGRHDVPAQTRSQKQRIDPKSLPVYHGNPVWLSDPTQHIEEWAFVDGVGRKLRLFSGDALELDAFAGDVFAYKPSLSVITNSRPLELEELRTMPKVWVEPISSDALANKELRGWYLVKIKYVENEIQTRFHFWNYSSKWLAFETEQY